MSRIASVALALCALGASSASADIVVAHELAGVYAADGSYHNSPIGQNYRVGLGPITTDPEHRNFFIFDLTGYAPLPMGSVVAAELKLYMPGPGVAPLDPGPGYVSVDMSETYRVTATPFSPADLADPTNTAGEAMAIFGTLGVGPALAGEKAVSMADNGTMVSIPLTPMALGAINGLLGTGKIAFGGRIATFDGTHIASGMDEIIFAFTDIGFPHMAGKEPMLVITTSVPEASAWMLAVVAAMAGGGAAVSRRLRWSGAGPATNVGGNTSES